MSKTFIILKYFHIQTSAIKRKYPTMIIRIFLVSRTHSISRSIHIQTLCVHKRNVLTFLQHGTYHVVVRGGSRFCQSPKGGGSGVFLLKRKGGPTLFWEKITKFPSPPPPPPRKNVPSLTVLLGSACERAVKPRVERGGGKFAARSVALAHFPTKPPAMQANRRLTDRQTCRSIEYSWICFT